MYLRHLRLVPLGWAVCLIKKTKIRHNQRTSAILPFQLNCDADWLLLHQTSSSQNVVPGNAAMSTLRSSDVYRLQARITMPARLARVRSLRLSISSYMICVGQPLSQ